MKGEKQQAEERREGGREAVLNSTNVSKKDCINLFMLMGGAMDGTTRIKWEKTLSNLELKRKRRRKEGETPTTRQGGREEERETRGKRLLLVFSCIERGGGELRDL